MDSGSNDRGVSGASQTVVGGGEEADAANLNTGAGNSSEEILAVSDQREPCFTEAELTKLGLLPVPEWARKPPGPRQRGLFD